MSPQTDLHDVSRCPLGVRCESCGAEGAGLAVATTDFGVRGVVRTVACLTLCPRCASAGMPPPVTAGTAARLAAQHCGHLGISIGQMVEALHRGAGA